MKKTPVAMALDGENYSTVEASFTKPIKDMTTCDWLLRVGNGTMNHNCSCKATIYHLQHL